MATEGTTDGTPVSSELNNLEKAYAGGMGLDPNIQGGFETLMEYLPIFMSGVLTPPMAKKLVSTAPSLSRFLNSVFSNPQTALKNKKTVDLVNKVVKESRKGDVDKFVSKVADMEQNFIKSYGTVNPRPPANLVPKPIVGSKDLDKALNKEQIQILNDQIGEYVKKSDYVDKNAIDKILKQINKNRPKDVFEKAAPVPPEFKFVDDALFPYTDAAVGVSAKSPSSVVPFAKTAGTGSAVYGAYKLAEEIGEAFNEDKNPSEFRIPEALPTPYAVDRGEEVMPNNPGMTRTRQMDMEPRIDVVPTSPPFDPMKMMIDDMTNEDNIF